MKAHTFQGQEGFNLSQKTEFLTTVNLLSKFSPRVNSKEPKYQVLEQHLVIF